MFKKVGGAFRMLVNAMEEAYTLQALADAYAYGPVGGFQDAMAEIVWKQPTQHSVQGERAIQQVESVETPAEVANTEPVVSDWKYPNLRWDSAMPEVLLAEMQS